MSTQLEAQASPVPVSKKIFISYSRRDKAWVNDYLKPLLTAADVQFAIDDEDLDIGVLLGEGIRKLIKECPYILFVMTPDWVDRKWTNYEAELALDEILDAKDRRVLPIKLRNCTVPPRIAPRLFLDLCVARQRDKEIVKLLEQIGVSQEGIAKAMNCVAKKTLLLLIELLEEPKVREEVSKLQEMFLQIQRSNEILVSNKQLHDDLQDIQQAMSQLPRDTPLLEANQAGWYPIRSGMSALCVQIEELLNHASAITDELVDVAFVDFFKDFPDELEDAVQARDARRFFSHLAQVSRQLDRSLPKINDRIVQHVKERHLEDLENSLWKVYKDVADVEFDEDTTALLTRFRAGIETLTELDQAIRHQVDDHYTLQEAEMDFQQMIRSGEPTYYDISIHWGRVGNWIGKLKLVDRYEKLLKSYNQLCEQLNDDRTIRDDQFEEAVKWNFDRFVHETRKAFNKLDVDLLTVCRKLTPHGDELQQILHRMQSDDSRD